MPGSRVAAGAPSPHVGPCHAVVVASATRLGLRTMSAVWRRSRRELVQAFSGAARKVQRGLAKHYASTGDVLTPSLPNAAATACASRNRASTPIDPSPNIGDSIQGITSPDHRRSRVSTRDYAVGCFRRADVALPAQWPGLAAMASRSRTANRWCSPFQVALVQALEGFGWTGRVPAIVIVTDRAGHRTCDIGAYELLDTTLMDPCEEMPAPSAAASARMTMSVEGRPDAPP
jgi:hypothetical protein